jgi:hypothetical protein
MENTNQQPAAQPRQKGSSLFFWVFIGLNVAMALVVIYGLLFKK